MSSSSRPRRRFGKTLAFGTACIAAGFCAGALVVAGRGASADADSETGRAKQMVVRSFRDAPFLPTDPKRPDGTRAAVLWGDPTKGPSDMLLRLKKGGGQLHVHTSDYHLVLLQGTMKHRAEGTEEADAEPLEPGSYWFQPGDQGHGDTCLTDECIMFIHWAGVRDGRLVASAKK